MSDLKERYLAAVARRKLLHAPIVKHAGDPDYDEEWEPYLEANDDVVDIVWEIIELARMAGLVVSLPLEGAGRFCYLSERRLAEHREAA